MFDYFYGTEPQQYAYYTVPKLLFTDDKFKYLSSDSKLLYSFLLDRASLSVKNNWLDNDGKVFVYFTQEELCEKLNIGMKKAVKLFSELDEEKGIGLISRKKQGQGKPTKIYVKNFTKVQTCKKDKSENSRGKVKTCENDKSKPVKKTSQDKQKRQVPIESNPNRVNLSNQSLSINQQTNSKTEVSGSLKSELLADKIDMIDFKEEKSKIFEQIDGDIILLQKNKNGIPIYSREQLEELVDLIAWTNLTPADVMKINGVNLDTAMVRRQFEKLDDSHITYVLDCLDENTAKIKNRRNYLLTCLYNAPSSIDGYYKNLVNHDLYGD